MSKPPFEKSNQDSEGGMEAELKERSALILHRQDLKESVSNNPSALLHSPELKTQEAVAQLLRLVVEGEQDEVERIVSKNKKLLLEPGKVTDLSGRVFEDYTAFQCAVWALDWHMWKMLLKYLSQEEAAEQLSKLRDNHFSLEPLIQALAKYHQAQGGTIIPNGRGGVYFSYDQVEIKNCFFEVGKQQMLLPANIVNEYCREDRAFYPCPTFCEAKLPRTRMVEVYDFSEHKWIKCDWFKIKYNGKSCGDSFIFFRDKQKEPWLLRGQHQGLIEDFTFLYTMISEWWSGKTWSPAFFKSRSLMWVIDDGDILEHLWKTRTKQLKLLKIELTPPEAGMSPHGKRTEI